MESMLFLFNMKVGKSFVKSIFTLLHLPVIVKVTFTFDFPRVRNGRVISLQQTKL